MIGTSAGAYRILEKIRDGGAGSVFKAQGPKGEIVAIKMISEAWNEQRDRRKAFKREAEITQKLLHPGVIRVFAYSEGPPRPYIVLEYFPSENLKFTLWHKQQVLEGRRMPILKQCAEALYYVHTQGVVHRDVKPENFLVNAEGSVRLIDFSIAQTKWDRFLFSFGQKVDGTPLYMAPEQIRNESLDQRADLYSFGVMVFELMTRRPPFIGASVDSILEKHLKSAPPSMRSIVQDVSPELDELVTKILSKKPADRPADMSFVIAALSRLSKKEEETLQREQRGPSRIVASIGQAGGTTTTPGSRPPGSRPTPGPVPAAGGAAPAKPPTSSALPAAKPAEPAAAATSSVTGGPTTTKSPTKVRVGVPPGAASAAGPAEPAVVAAAAGGPTTTKSPTKVRVPAPQPVTRTQTRAGVPSAQTAPRTQTKAGVPSPQPVTRTQTKAKPAGGAAPAASEAAPPAAPQAVPPPQTEAPAPAPASPVPSEAATTAPASPAPAPASPTPEPPPPDVPAAAPPTAAAPAPSTEAAAPPATPAPLPAPSPAAAPEAPPAAKEVSEATPTTGAHEPAPTVEAAPEPPKGNA